MPCVAGGETSRAKTSRAVPNIDPLNWDDVFTLERLWAAWDLVRRGGDSAGTDGLCVDDFAVDAPRRLRWLLQRLHEGDYRGWWLRGVSVPKPAGGTRRLAIPAVQDRVVDQALRLALEPLLAPQLMRSCFAYRRGMGPHHALAAIRRWVAAGHCWVLRCDIRKFFDSIEQPRLLASLAPMVDERLSKFLRQRLRPCVSQFGRVWRMRRGLAQGSPLSPLLANWYLTSLDRSMDRAPWRLARYSDDLVVCCPSRTAAAAALERVIELLYERGLKLNSAKTQLLDACQQPYDFLGFRIGPGAQLAPTPLAIDELLRHQRRWLEAAGREMSEAREHWGATVRSFAWYYHACYSPRLGAQIDCQLLAERPSGMEWPLLSHWWPWRGRRPPRSPLYRH